MNKSPVLFRGKTAIVKISTLILAVLVTLASLFGILAPQFTYTTLAFQLTFIPNDWVNLVVGVPVLLICLWATHREKMRGLLTLPGILVYVIYSTFNYLLPLSNQPFFLLYLLIVIISVYSLITWVSLISTEIFRKNNYGKIQTRISAGILLFLGFFNLIRQSGLILNSTINQTPADLITRTVWINDLLIICPMLIIGGMFLWQQKPFGYLVGPGLLFQYAVLAFSVIPVLVYQSMAENAPFDIEAIVVVGSMSILCLIPYFMLLRRLDA